MKEDIDMFENTSRQTVVNGDWMLVPSGLKEGDENVRESHIEFKPDDI